MWLQLKEMIRSKWDKPFSFIVNGVGLSLAFAVVIVMFTYIYAELDHDRNVVHREDIVRVEGFGYGLMPGAYGPWLETVFPEVEKYCRLYGSSYTVQIPPQDGIEGSVSREEVVMADSAYPSMFSLNIVKGARTGGLDVSGQVMLSESCARKFYGDKEPLGKQLLLGNVSATVTAVFEDITNPGLWSPGILVHVGTLNTLWGGNATEEWDMSNFETYLRLRPGADREQLAEKFKKLYAERMKKNGYEEELIAKGVEAAAIRNYLDIYFDPDSRGYCRHGNRADVNILFIITILVLVVSVINYVNMATARVVDKSRMIGVKRILGAKRRELISVIIGDSVFTCLIAMAVAFLLAKSTLPYTGQWLGLSSLLQLNIVSGSILFLGIPLVCGVLAGMFPALYLTKMERGEALSSRKNDSLSLQRVKGGLMVLQFAVSLGLIMSTLLICKQVSHMKHLDPGYDRNNMVVVHGNRERLLYSKYPEFRTMLLQNPVVEKVGASKDPVYNIRERGFHLDVTGKEERSAVFMTWVDENFLDLMGLKIVEGRSFREEDRTVRSGEQGINNKFIINQQMAKEIVSLAPGEEYLSGNRIGMVQDFNFKSMHMPLSPMYLGLLGGFNSAADVYIRIAPEHRKEALEYIEKCYRGLYPGSVYRYSFMDEEYALLYGSEDVFLSRLMMFTGLSVAIACLGLLAFVVFFIEQKTKSIGVRKVMGATELQVLGLLNRDFILRLFVGFIIATPCVFYIIYRWQSDFAYKTALSWWVFALALAGMVILALLCVSVLTWKAAVANPVDALKSE